MRNHFIKHSLLAASIITALSACNGDNDNEVKALQANVAALQTQLDQSTSSVTALQAELVTLTAAIADSSTLNQQQKAALDKQIVELNNMLSLSDDRFDALAMAESLAALKVILVAEQFATLRLMETTDIHAYLTDVNYYNGSTQTRFGLSRTATLIKQSRAEVTNSVLVDNGDLIQGNPIGDWMAAKGIEAGEIHPVYQVMNSLDYDVANYGNHEFNYGLSFLAESVNDANFPYISANVFIDDGDSNSENDVPYFSPYHIIDKIIFDKDGNELSIKIGFIGFVPPQIMVWDKNNLTGEVIAKDIKASAEKYIPQMQAEGADIIVAIPHSGIDATPYNSEALAENSSWYLSQVEGIDAIMFGHAHALFPSSAYANTPNTDIKKGSINGVPAVMPGYWGSHLGIIDLELAYDADNRRWSIFNHQVSTPSVDSVDVSVDDELITMLATAHTGTTKYMNQPIGSASDDMFSFLALVQDDPSVQIVSDAQKHYVEQLIQGDVNLENIPVLSAAAPFKACARSQNCANESDFVTVSQGDLALKDAADLYLYPNTLQVLKVSGSELKEWLECSAGMFNQIDVTSSQQQELVSASFPTYNFDIIDGVEYQIDVSQPARYASGCVLENTEAQRITNLTFNGEVISAEMEFLVASNNYRAGGGGNFPGTGGEHVVIEAPDANRDVLANYIRQLSQGAGTVNPSADNNWRFAEINSDIELNIVFRVPDTERVASFVSAKQYFPMTKVGSDAKGAIYQIDLSNQ
ncbi:bifunctional 2',3'-cyclic-nucleotide 2'-phosphodiesterase/3'-nucleotidase [Paraglaciecola sp.]|uniref:bifunctional 2',3'-cyclic-nucleotide 2'-phosphodiesterase/3'-nucleotidase n=1 Tax=Paraglaciecola sp. TaxID=1920173 RepID=UPI0030F4B3A1